MTSTSKPDSAVAPSTPTLGSGVASRSFRNNNFDVLRIFAATQVLIFHTLLHLSIAAPVWLIPLSRFPGVPIFFTISGFLVSASYERQTGHLTKYFKNRFMRIYPGLWGCILASILTILAFGYRFTHPADLLWIPAQLVGLLYTPHFLRSYGMGSYNGAFWTIPVELQFYFLVPIGYALVKISRIGNRGWILLLCVFIGVRVLLAHKFPGVVGPSVPGGPVSQSSKWIGFTFLPHFYLFLFGVVVQRYKAFQWKIIEGKGLLWLAFSFLLNNGAASFIVNPAGAPALLFEAVSMMILGISAISMAYTLPGLGERILRGQDISYGVYIYHGLWINILLQVGKHSSWRYFWIVFVAAYLSAALSWKLIEQPILRKKPRQVIVPTASC